MKGDCVVKKPMDLKGQRFGRLVVIRQDKPIIYPNKRKITKWLCKCDCGNQIVTRADSLRNGRTKSCGCLHHETLLKNIKKHGMAGSRIYITWQNMKDRCFNDKNIGFKNYGGRGITVCPEWKSSFEAFYKWALSSGYSDSLTIDRIDVNGNYEPGNCRWVSFEEQMNNKRNSRFITYKGITKTIAEWADEYGIEYDTLHARIKYYGWPIEKALTTPVKHL